MKPIGLLGGTTYLSTIDYYRLLNEMAQERLGGTHSAKILLWSFDFAEIEALQKEDRWDEVGARLAQAAAALETLGAGLLVIGANTLHRCAPEIRAATSVPLVHVIEETAAEAVKSGAKSIGLLGTRYTMEGAFALDTFADQGLDVLVPSQSDRQEVHRTIFEEFPRGQFLDSTREFYVRVVQSLIERGADVIVLGCTEIPVLLQGVTFDRPLLDTTHIHCAAAIRAAFAP